MGVNSEEWGRLRLQAKVGPVLEADQERQLLMRAQAGDASATGELIESHRRLVIPIAAGFAREGLSVHDLVAEGIVGLLEAVQRFDLQRDVRFASYASWWVRSCIRAYALANRRIVRMPDTRGARRARARIRGTEQALQQTLGQKPGLSELAQALGVSERDVELAEAGLSARDVALASDAEGGLELASDEDGPEQTVGDSELNALRTRTIHRAISRLAPRERRVIDAQLVTDGAPSLASIGSALGVSRQRVGQILIGARSQLRAELAAVL